MRTFGFLFIAMVALACPAVAGDVSGSVSGATLKLKGSAEGDDIHIDQNGLTGTQLRVTPGVGTTLNGAGVAEVFSDVTALKVDLKDGDDAVELCDAQIAGAVTIKLGKGGTGDQTAECASTGTNGFITGGGNVLVVAQVGVGGKFSMKGGPANDSVVTEDTTYSGDVKVDTGQGIDVFLIFTTLFSGAVKASLGSGANAMLLCGGAIGGKLDVKYGKSEVTTANTTCMSGTFMTSASGPNVLSLVDGDVDGSLKVKGGATREVVQLVGLDLGEGAKVDVGAGDNFIGTLTLSVTEDLVLKAGKGNDSLSGVGIDVQGNTKVTYGAGNNTVFFNSSTIAGDLTVKTGNGNDNVTASGAAVGGTIDIKTGQGMDSVN